MPDDLIRYWQQLAVGAGSALDTGLFTEPAHPLVGAGGRIAAATSLLTFKADWVDILPAPETVTETEQSWLPAEEVFVTT